MSEFLLGSAIQYPPILRMLFLCLFLSTKGVTGYPVSALQTVFSTQKWWQFCYLKQHTAVWKVKTSFTKNGEMKRVWEKPMQKDHQKLLCLARQNSDYQHFAQHCSRHY
jgi:hypothetical protein